MEAVFTYGTLEISEVMQVVTGRRFASYEASATGFDCFMIQHRIYPGMTPSPGKSTEGRVYLEVDFCSLQLLDHFEDEVYTRELVEVKMHSGESNMVVYAYVIPLACQGILSDETWDRQHFIDRHLHSYLEACRNFHQRLSGQIQNSTD
ncbi:MAG: gamma-glutamylcyclotransferase family protein [Nitrospirota bacterium]|nr:gamma-glutamylcyclotransferase family protein [Nitrospirota bacterium]